MLREAARLVAFGLAISDLAAITLALPIAYLVRSRFHFGGGSELAPLSAYWFLLPIVLIPWSIGLVTAGAYNSHRKRSFKSEAGELLFATFTVSVLASGFLFITRLDRVLLAGNGLSRSLLATWVAIGALILIAQRSATRWIAHGVRRHGKNYRNVLMVGTGAEAARAAEELLRHAHWGFRILGHLPFEDVNGSSPLSLGDPLGSADQLDAVLDRHVVDEVIISPSTNFARALEVAGMLQERGVMTSVITPPGAVATGAFPRSAIGDINVLQFNAASRRPVSLATKRVFDIFASCALLVILSPSLLIVAALILVYSGRPFLFRQTRVGLNGRPFTLYKFRTMVVDSRQRKIDLATQNSVDGPVFKAHHDPRVTRIGRLLRRFSIDELPQLWNVLTGSMSLVGPRPPIPEEVERYVPRTRRRLAMRPGMTGLWQVSGRSDVGFEAWIDMDLSYIDRWSFWLDTKILCKTLPAVLTGKGAY